jgi:hypothetical protein
LSRQLVFIHGRAQQHKDAEALKTSWIEAWQAGLDHHGLTVPIAASDIHFPYYGDTLDALRGGAGNVPDVIVKGPEADDEMRAFLESVLEDARQSAGVTDDQVRDAAEAIDHAEDTVPAVERGPLNWRWVRALTAALDEHMPGASGTAIALATADVWSYMQKATTRSKIDTGVRAALPSGADSVVVSHSLGTVIAYNLLKNDGELGKWEVPLFVTLGSPLAVLAIRRLLEPIGFPTCVGDWFNAMDPDDIVALYPLAAPRFGLQPPIDNKTDIDNNTPNQHGIAGYLGDPVVAKRIYDAI